MTLSPSWFLCCSTLWRKGQGEKIAKKVDEKKGGGGAMKAEDFHHLSNRSTPFVTMVFFSPGKPRPCFIYLCCLVECFCLSLIEFSISLWALPVSHVFFSLFCPFWLLPIGSASDCADGKMVRSLCVSEWERERRGKREVRTQPRNIPQNCQLIKW